MAGYKGGGPGNELRVLAKNLYDAGPEVYKFVKPVFKKAAQNIKTDWQENPRDSAYFGQISGSVGYDDESSDDEIRFVIGSQPSPTKGIKHGGSLVGISLGYTSRGGGHRTDPIEFMEAETETTSVRILRCWWCADVFQGFYIPASYGCQQIPIVFVLSSRSRTTLLILQVTLCLFPCIAGSVLLLNFA